MKCIATILSVLVKCKDQMLFLLFTLSVSAEISEIRVETTLFKGRRGSADLANIATATGLIQIDGCKWRMQLTNEPPRSRGHDSFLAEHDGKFIFATFSLAKLAEEQLKSGELKRMPDAVLSSSVYKGEVLSDPSCDEAGPLWLAFCSRCYLLNGGSINNARSRMFPVHDFAFSDNAVRPGMFSKADECDIINLQFDSVSQALTNLVYSAQGYLAMYAVTSFSSTEQKRFPKTATFQLKRIHDNITVYKVDINVVSVSGTTASISTPSLLLSHTAVTDYRDTEATKVNYLWQKPQWPTIDDLRKTKEYKEALLNINLDSKSSPAAKPPSALTSKWPLIVILSAVVGTIALLLIRSKKQSK